MGSLLGRIGNCGQPSDLLGFSLQAQPDAHALSTSRASFNYRSWWIMNRKSLKQMSLSDPGLLAAQRGKRLWAKLGNPCFPRVHRVEHCQSRRARRSLRRPENAACRRGRRWLLPWEPAGPRKRTERTAWKQHPERAGAIHSAARNKILARFRSAPRRLGVRPFLPTGTLGRGSFSILPRTRSGPAVGG
jgi:hypothetical protein